MGTLSQVSDADLRFDEMQVAPLVRAHGRFRSVRGYIRNATDYESGLRGLQWPPNVGVDRCGSIPVGYHSKIILTASQPDT